MAFNFAHGAVQWLAADAATTIYTISGLGFEPKAIRFYWQGLGSASESISITTNVRRGVSLTTGTSAMRCAAAYEEDGVATSVCANAFFDDCIAATLTSAPARDGALALNSITADGFTLIVNDATPVDLTLFYEVWGGSAITVATLVDILEPAATGDQDYAVSGFTTPDTDDQVLMFIGCADTLNTPARTASTLTVGCATGPAAGENIVVNDFANDAQATMDGVGCALDGECLGIGTGSRATMTQFNADGFRLNWIARSTTDRRFAALAMKGGKWRAGSYTIDAQTLNATATVSGLPFTPVGLSFMTRHDAETAPGVASDHAAMSLGTASSTASRRTMAYFSQDGVADANIVLGLSYDQLLGNYDFDLTVYQRFDLDLVTSDGFRIINEIAQAGESSVEWQGYLAFGSGQRSFILH